MLNKFFYCIFVILIFKLQLCAVDHESEKLIYIESPQQLRTVLKKILTVSEARSLVKTIQKEGPIRIAIDNHPLSKQFGAYWDMDQRMICLNLNHHQSEGELIGSIIFELHNALANSKLNEIDDLAMSGKINRENYVRAVEHLEYENSKMASELIIKGINLGIYPKNAHLNTYKNFEEHYKYQKIGGHSDWIAKNYDQLLM